ncbi:slipin family protein [Xenorhabdus szentirmaii]|uniref:slipin family protein n=1 Tax=Xenorhabdus szentirmaii TaxID=290112 RepID=UPI0019CB9848|nr:slipin family protein [Xenorhabdus sp. 38]MBD2779055.1 slipin family protein [Xenorhabdus sp. 38]
MIKKIKILQGQIGLLAKKSEYQQILVAGEYRFYDWFNKLKVTIFDLNGNEIETKRAEHLRQYYSSWIGQYCDDIQLAEDELGLLYEHDLLMEILPPATRRLYWKNGGQRRIEVRKTAEQAVPPELLALFQPVKTRKQRNVKGQENVLFVQIPAWHLGILKVDGTVQELLQPGIKGYWRVGYDVAVEIIDTRLQSLEVSGQEILTRDKVNLRINLSANWRYHDVLMAYGQLSEPVAYLYRELQFALREVVGTRSLDELLENKQVIDELVSQQLLEITQNFGLEVASLGVKDIILPGDMKAILSQVVEAEKSAQANVIRRREETAATRSLLNTAKVMENNPIALRLKELETLESIAERINQISVYGGLDQVLNGLVHIKGEQK